MQNPVAENVGNRANQMGNFRELSVGAGSSVFKMVNPWVWGGGVNPSSATFKIYLPTGALTTTGTINATGGTITGNLLVGSTSGTSVLIKGSTGQVVLQYNNASTGTIDGYTTEGSEVSYIRITAASGRSIKLKNSFIEFNGNCMPASDIGSSLGSTSLRWNDVYGKSIIAFGSGAKFSCDGNDGKSATYGYTDDNGNVRFFVFKGGILTDQHS